MTDTPGFFTTALRAYDNSNPFENEFGFEEDHRKQHYLNMNSNDDFFGFSPRPSPVPPDTEAQSKPSTFPNQDLDGMDLWNASESQNIQQHISARTVDDPNKDWILDPNLRQSSSLAKILTQDVNPNARVHHGQITPPSDGTPENERGSNGELAQQEQYSSRDTKKAKASVRRKRSSQVSTPTEPVGARRRKLSVASKSTISDTFDADDDELDEKRSKFLERNRVAASKCRQKKKEWTNNLEHKARELQNNKTQLAMMVGSLREEMLYLKGEVLRHNNCNCATMRDYLNREVQSISQQIPHTHGLSQVGPAFSGSPVLESMEVDHRSRPSTRRSSESLDSPAAVQELRELLTTEIRPQQ